MLAHERYTRGLSNEVAAEFVVKFYELFDTYGRLLKEAKKNRKIEIIKFYYLAKNIGYNTNTCTTFSCDYFKLLEIEILREFHVKEFPSANDFAKKCRKLCKTNFTEKKFVKTWFLARKWIQEAPDRKKLKLSKSIYKEMDRISKYAFKYMHKYEDLLY